MPGVDGRPKVWTEPSPSDFQRWADLVDEGIDPSEAARRLNFRGSATFGRTDPARHREVLDAWQERRRGEDRKTSRSTLREIAENTEAEHRDRIRAAEFLGKASGYLTDRAEIEVSGSVENPLVFELPAEKLLEAARILKEARAANDDDVQADPVHPA